MSKFTDLSILGSIPSNITISGSIRRNIKVRLRNSSGNIGERLAKDLNRSPAELEVILDRVLRDAISANIWRTRNGESDIIDSGRLLASQEVNYASSGITINYNVPYAALVHYGGYILPYGNKNARPVYIPPRPWVTDVINGQFNGFQLAEVYGDIIRRILAKY
jgi:phage gpG-like protein